MEYKPALRLRKAERAYPYILKLPSFMLVLGIKDRIVNSNCSTAAPRVSVYTWVCAWGGGVGWRRFIPRREIPPPPFRPSNFPNCKY